MTEPNREPPTREEPLRTWEHYQLWIHVNEAIYNLPYRFESGTYLEGVALPDLPTLSPAIGTVVEDQVVKSLNDMRAVWDPSDEYADYSFVRQAQTFPDVILVKPTPQHDEPLLGIELKSWYALAKEAEPNFRFLATEAACAVQDLFVIVPWALSNVISGKPRLFQPFVENAKYAARWRNYYWQVLRTTNLSRDIIVPEGITPYPDKTDAINDRAVQDSGKNFGRIARTGILDTFLKCVYGETVAGVELGYWLRFAKMFTENSTPAAIALAFDRFDRELRALREEGHAPKVDRIVEQLYGLLTELIE